MDVTLWAPVVAGAGAGVGLLVGVALSRPAKKRAEQTEEVPAAPAAETWLPPTGAGVAEVLRVLRSAALVLDAGDAVVIASPTARALGLVRGRDLAHGQLRELARLVRRDGVIREPELELARGPFGQGTLTVQVRVAPLGRDQILLLVDDHTQAQRVEAVRRDFVANVSHELKTPVGGISLLAEAVLGASDDPEAVERFARRIQVESSRLTQLVQEIVDLSRLQASDSLSDPRLVDVAPVAHEASERVSTLAEAKGMQVVVAADEGARVYGDAHMLGTAIDNLLSNAINYSEEGTRVALGVRQLASTVEITVSDQGQGIPASDLDRIFERFYRVDPARSRATGGTGLGLAIVKHIATNHGGEVKVWSEPGQGSTFTVRLPGVAEDESRGFPVCSEQAGEDTSFLGRRQQDGIARRGVDDISRVGRSGGEAER